MRRQAETFGAEFLMAEAESLKMDNIVKTVHTSRGGFQCLGILLATGAQPTDTVRALLKKTEILK
mgnify:CR=1 FL=1